MSARLFSVVCVLTFLGVPTSVEAGSHLWQINEVFSNADGTIQFIEMRECCGAANETGLANKWVSSDTTGNQYDFSANLPPGSTANAYILLGTQAFADLPGAPTPDHIIPENFFDLDADEIAFWLYAASILTFGPGDLPTDGILSLDRNGLVEPNSPTNFAGETGSVDAGGSPDPAIFVRGDSNGDQVFNALVDGIFLLSFGFIPGSTVPPCLDAADADDDGVVNALTDALRILQNGFVQGSPPIEAPWPDCGLDPTDDTLDCLVVPCP